MRKLDILILAQRSRQAFLDQLLSILAPQHTALGLNRFDQVDIVVNYDERFRPGTALGDKRQFMRLQSHAEYSCFVDDDDLVAPDYIARILPLLDGVDQIGWEQEVWKDHTKLKRDFHTLAVPGWTEDALAFHRDISHLQPMRREVALAAPMEGGYGEDARWSARLRELGVVKTEHYIDAICYFYLWRTQKNDAADPFDPWRLAMIESLK